MYCWIHLIAWYIRCTVGCLIVVDKQWPQQSKTAQIDPNVCVCVCVSVFLFVCLCLWLLVWVFFVCVRVVWCYCCINLGEMSHYICLKITSVQCTRTLDNFRFPHKFSVLLWCFRRETIPVSVLQLCHCPEQHTQGPSQAPSPRQRDHCHDNGATSQSAMIRAKCIATQQHNCALGSSLWQFWTTEFDPVQRPYPSWYRTQNHDNHKYCVIQSP